MRAARSTVAGTSTRPTEFFVALDTDRIVSALDELASRLANIPRIMDLLHVAEEAGAQDETLEYAQEMLRDHVDASSRIARVLMNGSEPNPN
jgi:hypothetical protein